MAPTRRTVLTIAVATGSATVSGCSELFPRKQQSQTPTNDGDENITTQRQPPGSWKTVVTDVEGVKRVQVSTEKTRSLRFELAGELGELKEIHYAPAASPPPSRAIDVEALQGDLQTLTLNLPFGGYSHYWRFIGIDDLPSGVAWSFGIDFEKLVAESLERNSGAREDSQ